MSDTPITDNAILTEPYQVRELEFEVVKADHMAELERELNEANAQLRSLKLELKEFYNLKDSLVKGQLELGETLKEANADRLRLRVALQWAFGQVEHRLNSPTKGHKGPCGYGNCDASCEDAYYWSQYYPLCEEALTTPSPPVVAKPDADALVLLLGSIMRDLPTNKDWLDPALERSADEALETYRNKYQEVAE